MFKFKNQRVWWTSDWHRNHLNLCRGTSAWADKNKCRPFNTLEEMWSPIRDNVNRLVMPEDILVNQGDLLFGDKSLLPQLLDEINCKNWIYIYGNHCDWLRKNLEFQKLFKYGCHDYVEIAVGKRLLISSHYAFRTWKNQHKGSIMLFGHSHNSLPDDPNALAIDVGVDVDKWGHEKYTPFSDTEIFNIVDKMKSYKDVGDHHQLDNKG